MWLRTVFIASLLVVVACSAQPEADLTPVQNFTPTVVNTAVDVSVSPTFTQTPESVSATATPFVCNEDWQSLPVIPAVSDQARALYQQGLVQGNTARTFSKIGDGEISTDWFLTAFDLGEEHYDLGDHQNLEIIIETFHGSFERRSVAAQRGFNTKLILDPAGRDSALCKESESPLDCELRIHNPSIALLSLGTNQVHRPEEFEIGMRQIINRLLSRKVLPILSTKGDNLEGDHRINRTIACLSQEYRLPLWNFWSAIQPLPNHGLQSDQEHLTYFGINDFDDPIAMQSAWTVRNLTALQVLDEVWKRVNQ
jgi:hypothetical protein